jgi:glycosyltransferase involved in cell wall biosynthesis
MKLLFITEFFPDEKLAFSGGVESRTFFTIQGLEKNHDVTVIARSKKHITATNSSIFSRVTFMLSAMVKAAKSQAHIIEGSNVVCYLPAFIAAKLSGARSVAWYADVYDTAWFRLMPPLVAFTGFWLEKIGLHMPWDHVIAMSEATKKKLIQKGVPKQNISVIYGGVDVRSITAMPHGSPFAQHTICTAARLVSYKHVDHLIQAFALVLKKVPHARLMIMGDGPERHKLETLAATLHIAPNVVFTGALPHPQVIQTMKRAHVFSLPSSVEGFGLVSIEAMACGLPYVSADIPATREITRGGTGGYLYPMGQVEALAKHIIELLSNEMLYKKKQAASRALAKTYDWTSIIKETELVYESLGLPHQSSSSH